MDQDTKQFLLEIEERIITKLETKLTKVIEDEVSTLARMTQAEFVRTQEMIKVITYRVEQAIGL